MSRMVRETPTEAYDPDSRAMATVAMRSSFLLVPLLSNPGSNPFYLFGLVVAVPSLIVSVMALAAEMRRQPRRPEMTGGD